MTYDGFELDMLKLRLIKLTIKNRDLILCPSAKRKAIDENQRINRMTLTGKIEEEEIHKKMAKV